MKSNTRDRVKLFLIFCVLAVGVLFIFNITTNKTARGVTTEFTFVEASNTERIERLEINKNNYGYKVEDNDNIYLKGFFYDNGENKYIESNVKCTKEQMDNIPESSKHWLKIKYIKGDSSNQVLEQIYKENPNRR
ncbi:MAG: hypothetical protein RR891_07040 [Clostridium sp.]|uniref:hypothetical protein n=1 Tax=Clostridium sp. TaxID=1506 RepID=UPI003053493B